MTAVVSDTSPIRALVHLELVDVLSPLFGQILLPPAVASELVNPPSSFALIDVSSYPFLVVRSAADTRRVAELCQELDRGEAEAIALAEEVHADIVLIDETAGRSVVRRSGLAPLGTLGVLLRAKSQNLCGVIRPLLDQLRDELRFHISPALRGRILQLAGEVEHQ